MSIFNENGICLNSEVVSIGECRINLSSFNTALLEADTAAKADYIKNQIEEVKAVIRSLDNKEIQKQMDKVSYIKDQITNLIGLLGGGFIATGTAIAVTANPATIPTALVVVAIGAILAGCILIYTYLIRSEMPSNTNILYDISEKLRKLARETSDPKLAEQYNKAARKTKILMYRMNRNKSFRNTLDQIRDSAYDYTINPTLFNLNVYSYIADDIYEANQERYDTVVKNFEKSIYKQGMKIFAKKFKQDYKDDLVVRTYKEEQIIDMLAPIEAQIFETNNIITIKLFVGEKSVINQPEKNLQNSDILLGRLIAIKFHYKNDDKTLDDVTYYVTQTSSVGLKAN
jgi:hypothetical protein